MIKNQDLIDRFFRYVKIDTQSAEDTGTQPSTARQHDLAKLLYRELNEMGVEAHYDRKNCYVYAKLPGEEPAIGFIAHMDTSPAASGANVHPRIEENYQGHSILLFKGHAGSESIVMRHEAFPELQNHIGEDLIVTNGKTLLGADDKAGVAEIMNLLAYYTSHPELPHRTICVAFTPDRANAVRVKMMNHTDSAKMRLWWQTDGTPEWKEENSVAFDVKPQDADDAVYTVPMPRIGGVKQFRLSFSADGSPVTGTCRVDYIWAGHLPDVK